MAALHQAGGNRQQTKGDARCRCRSRSGCASHAFTRPTGTGQSNAHTRPACAGHGHFTTHGQRNDNDTHDRPDSGSAPERYTAVFSARESAYRSRVGDTFLP